MNYRGESAALANILLAPYGAGVSPSAYDQHQLNPGSRSDEPDGVACEVSLVDANGVEIETRTYDSISAATHFAIVSTRDREDTTAIVTIEEAAPVLVYGRGVCIHHYERPSCDVCGMFDAQLATVEYPANAERGPSRFRVCQSCDKGAI